MVEIKFPPDTMDAGQRRAYEKIGGDNVRLIELGPSECCCENKEGQPSRKEAQDAVARNLELLLLGLTLTALVLDDLIPSGATQADDVLIPAILLRMKLAF